MRNKPSIGLYIHRVGIEDSVRALKTDWTNPQKPNTQLDYDASAEDKNVAYADVVLMGYKDNYEYYKQTIQYHINNIGRDISIVKKNNSLADKNFKVFLAEIRIYWYPPGSRGHTLKNCGMRDILLKQKECPVNKPYSKAVRIGDRSPEDAVKIMTSVMNAQTNRGAMRAIRGYVTSYGNRKFLSGLSSGNTKPWTIDAGTGEKKLIPEIHFRAAKEFLEYRAKAAGYVESIFDFDDFDDLDTETPIVTAPIKMEQPTHTIQEDDIQELEYEEDDSDVVGLDDL